MLIWFILWPKSRPGILVHGWDRIEMYFFYSLLGLSTHKNVKCYPTITKYRYCRVKVYTIGVDLKGSSKSPRRILQTSFKGSS